MWLVFLLEMRTGLAEVCCLTISIDVIFGYIWANTISALGQVHSGRVIRNRVTTVFLKERALGTRFSCVCVSPTFSVETESIRNVLTPSIRWKVHRERNTHNRFAALILAHLVQRNARDYGVQKRLTVIPRPHLYRSFQIQILTHKYNPPSELIYLYKRATQTGWLFLLFALTTLRLSEVVILDGCREVNCIGIVHHLELRHLSNE